MHLNRALTTLLTLACLLPSVPANGMLRNVVKFAQRTAAPKVTTALHITPKLNTLPNRHMSVASAKKTRQSSGRDEKHSHTSFNTKAALGTSLVALAGAYHLHEDEQRLRNTSTACIEAKWTDATSDIREREAEIVFAAMVNDPDYAKAVAQALMERFKNGITTDKELRIFIIACKFSPLLAVALTELVCKSSNNLNCRLLKTIEYPDQLPNIYTDEQERMTTYKACTKLINAYDKHKQQLKAEREAEELAEESER